jgi:glycosyltransferase involved in cell wall biosynthesis
MISKYVAPAQPRVIILLPSYNGEKYLGPQLDSIINQQFRNTLIVCRDDSSSDQTENILQAYAQQYPELFHLIRDTRKNLGVSANFSFLMQYVLEQGMLSGEQPVYVALSDQDDVWYPHKLTRCITVMQQQEQLTPGMPIAVHSDLRVVNAKGESIADSFAAYQGLQPECSRFTAQLLINTITGCTALLNPALLHRALPIPQQAIMHDWWLALVASAFGKICYINEPLIDYRQHNSNIIGAKGYVKPSIGHHFVKKLFDDKNRDAFLRVVQQAAIFREKYADDLTAKQIMVLRILPIITLLTVRIPPLRKMAFRLLRYF